MNQTNAPASSRPAPERAVPEGDMPEAYLLPKKRGKMTRVLLGTFAVALAIAIIVMRAGYFDTMMSAMADFMSLSGMFNYLTAQLSVIPKIAVILIVFGDVVLFVVRWCRRRRYYRVQQFDRSDGNDPC